MKNQQKRNLKKKSKNNKKSIKREQSKFNIGIDFGGVLSVHDSKNINDAGSEHKNTSINMPYAKEALKTLKNLDHNLFFVSYCGRSRARETSLSIKNNNLDNLFEKQYYVRSKEFKNELCKYIGCHFMIDDNERILDNIKNNNPSIVTILFGDHHSRTAGENQSNKHKIAKHWHDVLDIINSTQYFESVKDTKINLKNYIYSVDL